MLRSWRTGDLEELPPNLNLDSGDVWLWVGEISYDDDDDDDDAVDSEDGELISMSLSPPSAFSNC